MTKEFEKHKEAFLSEARTHVDAMNHGLLKLEKSPEDLKYLHDVFRAAHTLKSMSATMEYKELATLCHAMEDVLDAVRNHALALSNCVDELFLCCDFLVTSLKAINKTGKEKDAKARVQNLQQILKHKKHDATLPKVDNSKVNNSEETIASIDKVQSIEVKVEKLDNLLNLAEEMLVNKMKLEIIRERLDNPELSAITETMGRIISDLQYNVMKVRMVNIGFVFNQFPRMVRDLAKKQNKEVNLEIYGDDIELDRTIIDEISESVLHLIRNAIDHGLETRKEREEHHKNPVGQIRIGATRTKEFVVIEVSDDGRGLDMEGIKAEASARGLISKDEIEDATETADDKTMNTIFSGISTSKKVTDISGRGLGLNIVKQKVESVNGTIRVKTTPGQGTTFFIEIPLSLAVLKTLFVRVKKEIYAIPVMSVERLLRMEKEAFKGMLHAEAVVLEGDNIPIIRLRTLFGEKQINLQKLPIVVVQKDGQKLGIVVDELMTTQEVVIKPLNRSVKENRFFSGSAIIGSGDIVLILDVAQLIAKQKTSIVTKEVA